MDIPILIKNSNSYLKSIIGSGIKDSQVAKETDAKLNTIQKKIV